MKRIRRFFQFVAQRGAVALAALLFAIAVFLIWLVITGFSQSATTAAIGIAAISALFAAISSFANLLQAIETQKQRENQERPYVNAFFDGEGSGAICVIIQNSGNSPALDVKVTFDPEPVDFANRPLGQVSLFAKPISFLPAGRSLRQVIDVGHRFLAEGKPTQFKISVSYSSVYHIVYADSTDCDLAYMKQATVPRKSTEENLEALTKELKELVAVLKSVRGTGSLLVETPDQYAARLDEAENERSSSPQWKTRLRAMLARIRSTFK